MRILILGGTIEARRTAELLSGYPDVHVITSLAGRTDHPIHPPGQLRVGGFGGASGLRDYLCAERIDRVLDATHPFARRISANARLACPAARVPLVVLSRPQWEPDAGDNWVSAESVEQAAELVAEMPPRTVLLTIGRGALEAFAPLDRHRFVIRSVDAPACPLPARHSIVLARGPFTVTDEIDLMRNHGVDVLVTKNSGGGAAAPKLAAARRLGVTVVVVDRPTDVTGGTDGTAVTAGTDSSDRAQAPAVTVAVVTDPDAAVDQLLGSAGPAGATASSP